MTAVEWLVNELDLDMDLDSKWMIEQAKEIEQQQIENAFESGDLFSSSWFDGVNETSTNYYNETFKLE